MVVGSSQRLFWAEKNAVGAEFGNFVCCAVGNVLYIESTAGSSFCLILSTHTSLLRIL